MRYTIPKWIIKSDGDLLSVGETRRSELLAQLERKASEDLAREWMHEMLANMRCAGIFHAELELWTRLNQCHALGDVLAAYEEVILGASSAQGVTACETDLVNMVKGRLRELGIEVPIHLLDNLKAVSTLI